jgi:hypothetical protein
MIGFGLTDVFSRKDKISLLLLFSNFRSRENGAKTFSVMTLSKKAYLRHSAQVTSRIIDALQNSTLHRVLLCCVSRFISCYADWHYAEWHYDECHYSECHYAECCYDERHYAECHYAECNYAKCRYAECHYVEYHYAECHYAEYRYAEYHYPECHYAECHYNECRYAECHFADCRGAEKTLIISYFFLF